jgi:carotenoid cleavage dioxygenase-like enzyme
LPLNKRLFALWEGGSAYEIDPETLKTIGIQSWSPHDPCQNNEHLENYAYS